MSTGPQRDGAAAGGSRFCILRCPAPAHERRAIISGCIPSHPSHPTPASLPLSQSSIAAHRKKKRSFFPPRMRLGAAVEAQRRTRRAGRARRGNPPASGRHSLVLPQCWAPARKRGQSGGGSACVVPAGHAALLSVVQHSLRPRDVTHDAHDACRAAGRHQRSDRATSRECTPRWLL